MSEVRLFHQWRLDSSPKPSGRSELCVPRSEFPKRLAEKFRLAALAIAGVQLQERMGGSKKAAYCFRYATSVAQGLGQLLGRAGVVPRVEQIAECRSRPSDGSYAMSGSSVICAAQG